MKAFLRCSLLASTLALCVGTAMAGNPCCNCSGAAVISQGAPTPVAAPSVAANAGDRRTYSYEPGAATSPVLNYSGASMSRLHRPAVHSYAMPKALRSGYSGR